MMLASEVRWVVDHVGVGRLQHNRMLRLLKEHDALATKEGG